VRAFQKTEWVSALLLSLASVACIGLIYAIARRGGGDEREALVAALLMASAATLFYYSRHLVPYDASLAFALLALWVGLDPRPGLWRSALCGILAGIAFMIYNGYWLVAITALAAHLLFSNGSVRRVVERCIVAGLSFAFLPLLLTLATIARGSKPFVRAMFEFAHKVREQGYPPEGWSVPWAFLWHSEHGLLLAWVIGVVTLVLPEAIHPLPKTRASLVSIDSRRLCDPRCRLDRPYQVVDLWPNRKRIGSLPIARNGLCGDLPHEPLAVEKRSGDPWGDYPRWTSAPQLQ
jgi:4-amino-4-deoxy-L-arabinose transferase-like glycosyltransferase